MSSDSNKKYKRPKQLTSATTNPESSKSPKVEKQLPSLCPLIAKDSEWVDIMQPTINGETSGLPPLTEEEALLQLVDCEGGAQTKPLAIMFPDLIEKDPRTLEGVINRAMSTTEVTKHLVDLGQKADFTFMRKSNRLIPKDKQWLESLTESSNSHCSLASALCSGNISSDYEADHEADTEFARVYKLKVNKRRKKKVIPRYDLDSENDSSHATLSDNDFYPIVNKNTK